MAYISENRTQCAVSSVCGTDIQTYGLTYTHTHKARCTVGAVSAALKHSRHIISFIAEDAQVLKRVDFLSKRPNRKQIESIPASQCAHRCLHSQEEKRLASVRSPLASRQPQSRREPTGRLSCLELEESTGEEGASDSCDSGGVYGLRSRGRL